MQERAAFMTDAAPLAKRAPENSVEVRARLVEALQLDLVGPWAGHTLAAERLRSWERPSNWYLTGFLIPSGTPPERRADADEDDDLDEVPETAGLAEESNDERKTAKKGFFPSSMGLSFLAPGGLPRADGDRALGRLHAGGDRRQGRRDDHRLAAGAARGGDIDSARRRREVRSWPTSAGRTACSFM